MTSHGDHVARGSAIAGARWIMSADRSVALELLLNSLPTSLREVGLCFGPPVGLEWHEVLQKGPDALLQALVEAPSLEDFSVQFVLKTMGDAAPWDLVSLLQRRIDSAGDRWRKDFEPLPMQWSSKPDLARSPERAELSNEVRAWITSRPPSPWRSGERGELFALVAGNFDVTVMDLIGEYVDSPDEDRVQAVAVMLYEAPQELVWNAEFVTRCLRSADRISESSVHAIRDAFHNMAFSVRHGVWVGNSTDHSYVRQQAREIAAPMLPGTVESGFYLDLSDAAAQWEKLA